ncbi:MAG: hypothetical protein [Circular genetic element sp.]|nr:MAG: hypothetical protein [Circular genetic element sp.]
MASLVIPGAALVTIRALCSGRSVVNVIGVQNTVGTDPADVLANIKQAWEATSGPLSYRPVGLVMEGYEYTDLSSAEGPTGFLGSTKAGGITSQISTMASAALISLGGGTRSRSARGRLYHGPLTEEQVNADGRTLEATQQGYLNTAYENFRLALKSETSDWVVLSRLKSQYTVIGSVATSSIIATQRRRLR